MANDFANKAFGAFTVALAASVWALFADVGRPYLPSVPIVLFGIFLFANRDTVAAAGSDALRDSPYFLGFLLTMFGLFKLFNDVSFNFALFGRNPALLTEQVGGAVLTTIVGLFVRQALLLLIPEAEPQEDDRLAALAAAITSHAVAFEMARREFFTEIAGQQTERLERLDAIERRLAAQPASAVVDRLERRDDEDGEGGSARRSPIEPLPAGPFVPDRPVGEVPTLTLADTAPDPVPAPPPSSREPAERPTWHAEQAAEAARALDDAWPDPETITDEHPVVTNAAGRPPR